MIALVGSLKWNKWLEVGLNNLFWNTTPKLWNDQVSILYP